jgi:acyl carrier protein
LFSSVSALLGNPGQAAYAAGNAFLDALAHMRRAQGAPALSINWGPWRGDGMSATAAADLHRRWGLLAIDPADGVDMLAQLLSSSAAEAQIWAATLDAEMLRARLSESKHLSLVSELAGSPERQPATAVPKMPPRDTAKRLRDLPPEERAAAILEHVVEVVRSVAAMSPAETLKIDGRFDELGVDSLLSLDLIEALNRSLAVDMPPTITIDCPTIELLARHLADELEPAAHVSAAS